MHMASFTLFPLGLLVRPETDALYVNLDAIFGYFCNLAQQGEYDTALLLVVWRHSKPSAQVESIGVERREAAHVSCDT